MNTVVRKLLLSAVALLMFPAFLQAEPPPASPAGPLRGHRPGKNFRRRPPKAFFAKLSPEERNRIDQLARTGRKEELRKLMRELIFKYRPEEMKQLEVLGERYRKTQDEKERAAIRAEMTKLSGILFRKRQDFTKNNIAETERQLERARKELQRLKKFYQCNEENSDKIIAGYVDRMCLPPEQRRKAEHRPPHGLPEGPPPTK